MRHDCYSAIARMVGLENLRGPEVLRACCLQMSAFIGLQSPRNGLTTIIEEEFNCVFFFVRLAVESRWNGALLSLHICIRVSLQFHTEHSR